jgi:streptogramin lyase
MRQFDRRHWALGALLTTLCIMTSACSTPPWAASVPPPSPSPTASFGRVTLFPLSPGVPAPHRLVAGPDGNLWFTAFDSIPVPGLPGGRPDHDAIVRLTPAGVYTVFPLPWPGTFPDGISPGPDGNLWFTEFYGDAVGRATPQGNITDFLVPSRAHRSTGDLPHSQPHAIVTGPDGNLWFPDMGGNKVARITPTGALAEYPLPPHPANPFGSFPYSITASPDGALWFTEGASMRIGRISPDGRISEFELPEVNHVPTDILAGFDGAFWFLEPNQSLLGRITIDGRITEFALPHASCHTAGVPTTTSDGPCEVVNFTSGPDGAIWFSEAWRDALGRIDGQGHTTEYSLPPLSATGDGPGALALGPDGALWFAYGCGVGRFSL